MLKFLIYLHEQCAIDDPRDVRSWDKEQSTKFIDKEFLDEKILCRKERKRKKKPTSYDFPSPKQHIDCCPFNYQTQAHTCEDERFFTISLKEPPGELRLSNRNYGELLTVNGIIISVMPGSCYKIIGQEEKDNIKIPSGIFINTLHPARLCSEEHNDNQIFENVPNNILPVMKKILDLIKKNRYHNRMQNIYFDLENLELNANIPSYINIGCITPTSQILSIMKFSDLNIISIDNVIKHKLASVYVAFGYSKIHNFSKWTPRILDDILLLSKDNMQEGLNLEFVIQRHYIKLVHGPQIIIGRLNSHVKNTFNIYQGLLHFFLKSMNCIFHSETHYLLISRSNRSFYVYDPTGRLENLSTNEKYGLPCLIRLDNLCNVTYLILKLSCLFDNSPFSLSEIKCIEFFEISMKNCEVIKTRLKTAMENEEVVVEDEISYDLDEPNEFLVVPQPYEPIEITDRDLSNYNLIYWNYDRFHNTEIVKKFVEELLAGIPPELPEISLEEFIMKLTDQLIDNVFKTPKAKEGKIITNVEQSPIDNYIELPNNSSMVITSKEISLDMDIFSANLSFVAVVLEYGKISEWDSQFLNYIYHISYAVQSYFEPKKEDVLELNKFYCTIRLGCEEVVMAFTQIVKTYQEDLKGYLLNNLKKYNLLLVLSDTVIFVIVKFKEFYYYFDGNLRDTVEVWHYVQHQFGCVIRFKTVGEIISMLKRYNNKKYDYYHIFKVEDEKLTQNDFYEDFISVNLYKYHRTNQDGLFKIQGNTCLPNRNLITVDLLRPCYFTSIYVILFIMRLPLARWNADIIDLAIKYGPLLEEQIQKSDGANILYQKRFIENLAIDGYYFNIFVKEVFSETYRHDLLSHLKYFFSKRNLLILQFINVSFVILKDFGYHLFDPYASLEVSDDEKERPVNYGYPEYCYSANNVEVFVDTNTASWVYFMDLNDVVRYIKPRAILDENTKKGYQFWILNIVSYRRNYNEINRGIELKPDNSQYRNIPFEYEKSLISKVPNEHLKWLLDGNDYIPLWSRLLIKTKRTKLISNSITFGFELHFLWYNFEIEKENDIFSIWGTISPRSFVFKINRNKQYYSIYIMALFIMNIYNLSEMTSNLIDFIVIEGDKYFSYCVENITTLNYEISMDDMIKQYKVGNFQFTWSSLPLNCNNGILYQCKTSLSTEIKLFFESHRYRHGILECNEKILAFGVDVQDGYYIYDAQSSGFPLFMDCQGCAYMLRCLSLKRLTYLITRTLGIYEPRHIFVLHALSFDIKLREAKFYKGLYKRERIYIEPPERPECMGEKEAEEEPEPVNNAVDPFEATRIS